jgi:uncharacterized protein (DUF433 family)
MASVNTKYEFLERNPKSNYKQLFIKGTKIRARTLYGQYMSADEPRTIEEIAEDWNVPVEAVREAIAYCDTDPIDIREDHAREDAIMEATGMNDADYKYHPSPKLLSPQEYVRILREVEERFAREREARGE